MSKCQNLKKCKNGENAQNGKIGKIGRIGKNGKMVNCKWLNVTCKNCFFSEKWSKTCKW